MTFEEWSAINGLQHWNSSAITMMEDAWRSADRAAREECARICEKRASFEHDAARANAALRCADRIRDTINEPT
jgi:hypothetical protein